MDALQGENVAVCRALNELADLYMHEQQLVTQQQHAKTQQPAPNTIQHSVFVWLFFVIAFVYAYEVSVCCMYV